MKRGRPSLAVLVIIPVVIVGFVLAVVLMAVVSPNVKEHFRDRVDADLQLATELALRVCERGFEELLSLRLSEDPAMVETVRRDSMNEIVALKDWFPAINLIIVEDGSRIVASTCDCSVDVGVFESLPTRSGFEPRLIDANGRSFVRWEYFPLWRWRILAIEPIAKALRPLRMSQRAIFIAAAGTTIGLVAAFLLVFRVFVIKRLRAIAEAADALSQGEYPRIGANRSDEIGRVALAFDEMVTSVAEKDQAAEDAYLRIAESEARFRRVIEASSAGYFYFDAKDSLRAANRAFALLHGYVDEAALIGRHFESFVSEESSDRARSYIRELLSGSVVDSGEVVRIMKDGSRRYNTVSAAPVFDGGRVVGFEGFAIDTTEQHEALREKELLLQEVHHRVRNNLNVVVSLLRLQSANYPDDHPTTSAFEDAQSRIMSMAHVHSLLYESGSVGSMRVEDYVRRLANEVLAFSDRGTPIRLEIDVEPIEVSLDRAVPLGLIINEALTNSVKHAFGQNESPMIRVSFGRADGIERLVIKDNGPGFHPAEQVRAGALGMTIMSALASQLGGEIEIVSSDGTKVKLEFPAEE